jgi:hypothetical protein
MQHLFKLDNFVLQLDQNRRLFILYQQEYNEITLLKKLEDLDSKLEGLIVTLIAITSLRISSF